jgi:hypothetical protein
LGSNYDLTEQEDERIAKIGAKESYSFGNSDRKFNQHEFATMVHVRKTGDLPNERSQMQNKFSSAPGLNYNFMKFEHDKTE